MNDLYTPTCEYRHTWTEASGERCVCGAFELTEAVLLTEQGPRRMITSRRVVARG
jgi:hypothetical protein